VQDSRNTGGKVMDINVLKQLLGDNPEIY